jgi:transposase
MGTRGPGFARLLTSMGRRTARPQTIQSRTSIMPQLPAPIETVLGLDVAQDSVTLHDLVTGRTVTVANTGEALLAALEPLRQRALAVCEATGGHETVLLGVLLALAIPAHRADGAKISAFARSLHLAKTDRRDARTLALYGRERGAGLAHWTPPPAHQAALTALVRRRADLVAARKAERARTTAPGAAAIAASLARSLAFLDAEIAGLETAIAELIAATPQLERRQSVLTGLPGIGKTVAASLLALLPELGRLSRRQAAALAGVAPHPDQTGTTRNRGRTIGGRRVLRPVLFLAALTAVRGDNSLSHFYKRLVAAGKPKRLALVAVMRKLVVIANARIADLNTKTLQLT